MEKKEYKFVDLDRIERAVREILEAVGEDADREGLRGTPGRMARMYAEKLSIRLKQPVIVENRPGAGGVVGNALVGRAPADGYTLLFTPNPFTTAPMVLKLPPSASYDALHGFTPVIQTGTQTVLLVAYPAGGIKNVQEMVAAAKAGKALTYASPGAGSPMHIAGEWLNRAAGMVRPAQ